uniref:THAP domain-containing protein 1-like n=1 Tax=Myxine glutinosa TaxID=7769 RepID=UPI00358E33D7
MPACAAINCTKRQIRGCGKTFHLFPFSRPDVLQKWVVNVKRDKWKPSKKSVLCSDHFDDSCFDRTGQTTRLRENSLPTIFDFPTHLQKDERKRKPPKPRSFPQEALVNLQEPLDNTPSTSIITSPSKLAATTGADHTYAVTASPRSVKRKLDSVHDNLCGVKKKLKLTQQKSRRCQKKVKSLTTVVQALRDEQLLSENGADHF